MGYIGMCGSKGYGFSAILMINRVLILTILVLALLGMFLRKKTLFQLNRKSVLNELSPKSIRGNFRKTSLKKKSYYIKHKTAEIGKSPLG